MATIEPVFIFGDSMAKKKPTTSTKKKTTIVTTDDKKAILADMKDTMKDMGRLPRLIMAPIIGFVASKYEKIPQSRREHLQQILSQIKEGSKEGIHSLKDRFRDMMQQAQEATTWKTSKDDTSKKQPSSKQQKKTKKRTKSTKSSRKKTKKKSSKNSTSSKK